MTPDELAKLVNATVAPLGYCRKGKLLYRKDGNAFSLINLQRSPFGNCYQIELGVYFDLTLSLAVPPPFHSAHFKETVTTLAGNRSTRIAIVDALDLATSVSDESRSVVVESSLKQIVLPFLATIDTLDKVVDFLKPGRSNYWGPTMELRAIAAEYETRLKGSARTE